MFHFLKSDPVDKNSIAFWNEGPVNNQQELDCSSPHREASHLPEVCDGQLLTKATHVHLPDPQPSPSPHPPGNRPLLRTSPGLRGIGTWEEIWMGPYCPSSSPIPGHFFLVGLGVGVYWLHIPFYRLLGKFSDASGKYPNGEAIYL